MSRDEVTNRYFQWICDIVDPNRSHTKLLSYLFDVEFYAIMDMDRNRIGDAVALRRHFINSADMDEEFTTVALESRLQVPRVLEVMVGICYRGSNEYLGTIAGWFWDMCRSLEIDDQDDYYFNAFGVEQKIFRFLNREYSPNGKGGLFTAQYTNCDMRTLEIWHQMSLYINELLVF